MHATRPALIINPRSGGGKASRYELVARCRARGIEPIQFEPGDDLIELARAAVRNGADVIGVAVDGTQREYASHLAAVRDVDATLRYVVAVDRPLHV